MSHEGKGILLESPRQFFADQIDTAVKRVRFEPHPLSRQYLTDLLERYMFSHNLLDKGETLAELYLRAQNSAPPVRADLLKRLGDSSLYISGFFGDSLNRKLVDIDYYVDMGGVAYGALAHSAADGHLGLVYGEFSRRFVGFVDVLTFISQEALVQTNGDLLKLYDRYLATGSRLAEGQLAEKGLLGADTPKAKARKM